MGGADNNMLPVTPLTIPISQHLQFHYFINSVEEEYV